MQKNFFASLSDQELYIIARQSGVLISRYYMKTKVIESLFDSPEERFGFPAVLENGPAYIVAQKIVSEDTKDDYLGIFAQMYEGLPSGGGNVRLRSENGEYRWHHADYSLIYDDQGEAVYALVTFSDNTEEREMELAAQKWHAGLSSVLSNSILHAELNLTKNVVEQVSACPNDAKEVPLPRSLADVVAMGFWGTMEPLARAEYEVFFNRQRLLGLFAENVAEDHFDYCVHPEQGAGFWVRAVVGMIKYPHSDDVMAMVSFSRLEDRQYDLEQLSHKAFHDALTGLLNRDGIEHRTQHLLAQYSPQSSTALFIIDLDDFKQINDHLGHQVGDLVLKEVAENLSCSFHQTDVIGRLGGDEFIILISGNFQINFLERKAMELLEAMRFRPAGREDLPISVSLGIAFSEGKLTFDKLYRTADIALYTAKRNGKNRFHLINADTNEEQSFCGTNSSADLLSLQALLDYADTEPTVKARTPYKALVDNMPGGVVVVTMTDTLKITHCNDWPMHFSGLGMEELKALQENNPLVLVHPDDHPIFEKIMEDIKGGMDSFSISYRIRHHDGTYHYINLSALMTERSQNEIVFYGIQTDVDEMLRVQTELDASKRKLQAIIDAIPGGIAVFELEEDLSATYYGNWLQQFLGYTNEEIGTLRQGLNLFSVLPEDLHLVQDSIARAKAGLDVFRADNVRIRHKDGHFKSVNIKGSVIERAPDKLAMYAIFTAVD